MIRRLALPVLLVPLFGCTEQPSKAPPAETATSTHAPAPAPTAGQATAAASSSAALRQVPAPGQSESGSPVAFDRPLLPTKHLEGCSFQGSVRHWGAELFADDSNRTRLGMLYDAELTLYVGGEEHRGLHGATLTWPLLGDALVITYSALVTMAPIFLDGEHAQIPAGARVDVSHEEGPTLEVEKDLSSGDKVFVARKRLSCSTFALPSAGDASTERPALAQPTHVTTRDTPLYLEGKKLKLMVVRGVPVQVESVSGALAQVRIAGLQAAQQHPFQIQTAALQTHAP